MKLEDTRGTIKRIKDLNRDMMSFHVTRELVIVGTPTTKLTNGDKSALEKDSTFLTEWTTHDGVRGFPLVPHIVDNHRGCEI